MQYYRDEPALNDGGALANFPGNSALFKLKWKITVSAEHNSTKKVEIMVLWKYLSSFWKTLEMLLINC